MAKTQPWRRFRSVENTGFPSSSGEEATRLMSRTGRARLRKTGMAFWKRYSIYHSLLQMPRWKFLTVVFAFYTIVNLLFAATYFILGTKNLAGAQITTSHLKQFEEAFFFSAQSLTTVGYGRVAPISFWTNMLASFEALVGILSFAVVTGIFYARFSRPRAFIVFSKNMLLAPFRNGRALMFRMATYKNNYLTDVEATTLIAMHVPEGEGRVTKFFPLRLDIARISSLALNWTLVHPIDDQSPLFGMTVEQIKEQQLEVIVNIKAFDDHFSNTVQQRSSYTHEDLICGARFLPMFAPPNPGGPFELALDKINAHEMVALPPPEVVQE